MCNRDAEEEETRRGGGDATRRRRRDEEEEEEARVSAMACTVMGHVPCDKSRLPQWQSISYRPYHSSDANSSSSSCFSLALT